MGTPFRPVSHFTGEKTGPVKWGDFFVTASEGLFPKDDIC